MSVTFKIFATCRNPGPEQWKKGRVPGVKPKDKWLHDFRLNGPPSKFSKEMGIDFLLKHIRRAKQLTEPGWAHPRPLPWIHTCSYPALWCCKTGMSLWEHPHPVALAAWPLTRGDPESWLPFRGRGEGKTRPQQRQNGWCGGGNENTLGINFSGFFPHITTCNTPHPPNNPKT